MCAASLPDQPSSHPLPYPQHRLCSPVLGLLPSLWVACCWGRWLGSSSPPESLCRPQSAAPEVSATGPCPWWVKLLPVAVPTGPPCPIGLAGVVSVPWHAGWWVHDPFSHMSCWVALPMCKPTPMCFGVGPAHGVGPAQLP